jgi:hypothetical protein
MEHTCLRPYSMKGVFTVVTAQTGPWSGGPLSALLRQLAIEASDLG